MKMIWKYITKFDSQDTMLFQLWFAEAFVLHCGRYHDVCRYIKITWNENILISFSQKKKSETLKSIIDKFLKVQITHVHALEVPTNGRIFFQIVCAIYINIEKFHYL